MAHCTPLGSLLLEVYNELSALGCPLYTPAPDPSSGLEPLSPKFGVQICLTRGGTVGRGGTDTVICPDATNIKMNMFQDFYNLCTEIRTFAVEVDSIKYW